MSIQDYADEINELLRFVYIPERNCSCHINPPCSDCVDNGYAREAFRTLDAAVNKEPTAMSTNASLTYAMLLPNAITVKVKFIMQYNGKHVAEPEGESYTYKALTDMGLAPNDVVVVPIRSNGAIVLRTAIVATVDEFLDVSSTKDYHWVVQKVDTTQFDAMREKEITVAKHLQLRERERARQELMKELLAGYENENELRRELGLEEVPAPESISHEQV